MPDERHLLDGQSEHDEIRRAALREAHRWLLRNFPSGTTMMAESRKHGDVKQTKAEYVAAHFKRHFGLGR